MAETTLNEISPEDLDDIQGIVLSGWGKMRRAVYVFSRFDDVAGARRWLASMSERMTSADRSRRPADVRLQVALGQSGLTALGLETGKLGFSQELALGMAQRARFLGDEGASAPATWQLGHEGQRLDALTMIFATGDEELARQLDEHRARHADAGMVEVAVEHSELPAGREHFGFVDGIAQPFVAGAPGTPRRGQDVIPAGEFLLGHENAYGKQPQSPILGGVDIGKNGSYLVFRKLEQNVPAFWRYFTEQARELAGSGATADERRACATWLAAKVVGRWPSGASLMHAPDADDPAIAASDRVDDFSYLGRDPHGDMCPIAAHTRRANPRDARGGSAAASREVVRRHRMLRRGRPYGAELDRDDAVAATDDAGARGLYFIALQSSIARGFEFVQQTWLANPGFHGLQCETDPIAVTGSGDGHFTIPARPLRLRLAGVPSFVTTRGGGYFFLPSRSALRVLASVRGWPGSPRSS